ncbi:BON domain-containing protein [Pedobacter gandavensis]|uniref:BON domain-containing protein n=1 Tax=Pedobacter gandavensis TaxID=2679963 RepID=UPI0024786DF8|nr:BON domain-containing protein [Pedobacter gandavensis]WGQ09818.1 BON domain-containing protein [Pedobacter gandavensis]
MENDFEIQKNVMEEIGWEPALKPSEIGVAVKNGVVTLSGQVDSFFKKQTAEKAAKRVKGVKAIAEDIQIGVSPSYERSDADIAAAVVNALKWHSDLDGEKIIARVEDRIVRLEGEVEWDYQRKNAKTAVENLTGVIAVINLIRVKPKLVSTNIEKQIIAAFQRNAALDAKKITVNVEGNKVILTGTVRSFTEKDDAENAAWSAPGVLDVDSRLRLDAPEYAFYE